MTAGTQAAPPRRILGFAPTVFLLGIVSLANDMASEMIYPLLPVFLTGLGASMTFIGLLEGIAEATASILKLFSGWFADRFGRKRALTAAGYVVANVLRPLIGLATAPAQVLALRFAERTGKGLRTSPRDAIIADCTPVAERGRAYGFNRSMDHAGAMLGALIAFVLLTWFAVPLNRIFLFSAVPGLLAVICIVAGLAAAKDPPTDIPTAPKLSLKPFDGRFRWFLLAVSVFALGNSSDAFLLLRARELGITVAALPLLWIMLHGVKALSSTPAGALSDRFGRRTLICAGWGMYALVYIGFAGASRQWQAWLLFAGYGLYYGLTEGVEKAFVADVAPPALRSTAFGVYHFTLGIIALPASLLCGYLWSALSSHVALGVGAALAGFASLILTRVRVTRAN